MTDLNSLQFYATPEHTCSYLPDRQARTLFVDPKQHVDGLTYSVLSDLGFRRSGPHIYRPHCKGCDACISVRIPVQRFQFSRNQKRILNRNRDLSLILEPPRLTASCYQLYKRYIESRHDDGDMYPPSREQFISFLIKSDQQTAFYKFYQQGKLVMVSVVDRLDQGLSAIYTFYDPDLDKRSLGTYSILRLIQFSQQEEVRYLYLGYWIEACRKMSYKVRYRPLQLLRDGQWLELI